MGNHLSLKQRFRLSRFFQGEEPSNGPIELTQRRVFILPTQRGLGLVLTIVLLLLTAFIYDNNLVYMLAFLLASVFFVTILHTYRNLSGLVVSAGYLQPVFAGDAVRFSLTVKNPLSWVRPSLSAKLDGEHDFSLDARSTKTLILLLPVRRRGWQAIGTVTFSSSYPFGIFNAWSPLRFDRKVLVYPKPANHSIPLPVLSGGIRTKSGRRSIDRNNKDDFNGIRSYQPGDSLRQIHWRAYAKGLGLLSKQYASEAGGSELWLDYDKTPGAHREERLSLLCRWILDAEVAGMRYGLRLPGNRLLPNQGQKHQSACLEALALF
ncbi:MAG: DUF58 domain-containing protein [Gammaproteobacteria bacterium]